MALCLASGSAIIDGRDAVTGNFPNSVAILRLGEVFGGGSLVSPIHVITSCQIVGHFDPPKPERYLKNRSKEFLPYDLTNVTLAAGSRWIYSVEGGQSRKASDSYPHPDCVDTQFYMWKNDVGVIETSKQFDFGPNLNGLYYWTNSRRILKQAIDSLVLSKPICTVMGWGRTSIANYSEWLIYTNVRLVPPFACVDRICQQFEGNCDLVEDAFTKSGKLCALNLGSSKPGKGDLGNGLFCDGYYYGLTSEIHYPEISIYDRMDFSFDLYRTVVREARENKEVYFPRFSKILQVKLAVPDKNTASSHLCVQEHYIWLILLHICLLTITKSMMRYSDFITYSEIT
ncbi:hypothetical protein GE061_002223 [Apolygus lucorum]|uniref:Uncharacterized protein n=1 Tax=Apolygus lucorum TaxID=248454 RepID=A0A6A4J7M0_APOLU|nr:hypothetical protein GE061_002223 [Apolygus lucorum]